MSFREKIRRVVKARDVYGLVFDDVNKMQAMKHLRDTEAGPNPLPPGINETETTVATSESSVQAYDPSLSNRNQSSNVNSQLANVMKKAPAMPKPKWHPPWKLYRVIAGHLGWVRCIAVEPGNEVCINMIEIWESKCRCVDQEIFPENYEILNFLLFYSCMMEVHNRNNHVLGVEVGSSMEQKSILGFNSFLSEKIQKM